MTETREITAEGLREAAGRNKLLREVADWIIDLAPDYGGNLRGPMKDLFYGGCESAMVHHITMTEGAVRFGRKYSRQILAIAAHAAERAGEDNVYKFLSTAKYNGLAGDADGALNQLAWWGFEAGLAILARKVGY